MTTADTQLVLAEIARRYGTPTYAFDICQLRSQVERLTSELPPQVEILYSLKANASLGICDVLAGSGIGADVASAGEFATALAAGFPEDRIFVAGPYKLAETLALLRTHPRAVVSVDSQSELEMLAGNGLDNPLVLRLRPDFGSCAVVPAGSESRFGFTCDAIRDTKQYLDSRTLNVIGFHVFAGSQVLDADKLNEHLRRSLELSLRAAETIGIQPTYINLGGGFGVPYAEDGKPLDLPRVAETLATLAERAAPTKLVLELGRFLVAESGWYLTSVIGHQEFQGNPAVIVDGGVHQRADMCGLCLRTKQAAPLVLQPIAEATRPTSILGCLSLPDDVMLEGAELPELPTGHTLAFARAGAYGLWSSPALFHGSPLPAEVAFERDEIYLMRERKVPQSILDDQRHVFTGNEMMRELERQPVSMTNDECQMTKE